jgi:hypothetical protein
MGWTIGALAVVVAGLGLRGVLGGASVGDRSAMAMSVLLCIGVWVATRLLGGPRVAFFVTIAAVALLDLAALPQRSPPPYDDLEAFYRTDQVLSTRVSVPAGVEGGAALTVLAQPTFAGTQPHFGLAGMVNGAELSWNCTFDHGLQTLALPLPGGLVRPGESADVQLHLSGSPSRETDYLVVYASSQRGGFVVSLVPTSGLGAGVTTCVLA